MKEQGHISIRINGGLHDKFQYIAAYEGRSMSGLLLYFIQKCVREFEQAHGIIDAQQVQAVQKKK